MKYIESLQGMRTDPQGVLVRGKANASRYEIYGELRDRTRDFFESSPRELVVCAPGYDAGMDKVTWDIVDLDEFRGSLDECLNERGNHTRTILERHGATGISRVGIIFTDPQKYKRKNDQDFAQRTEEKAFETVLMYFNPFGSEERRRRVGYEQRKKFGNFLSIDLEDGDIETRRRLAQRQGQLFQ